MCFIWCAGCEPASTGGLDSCCKPVKYRDEGRKDLCAPCGLTSALHAMGAVDNQGGDLGERIKASAAKIAKAKDAVKACVAQMEEAGWTVNDGHAFTKRGAFDPLANVAFVPTIVQLSEVHCVITIEDDDGKWVYDSNENFALPLTRASLERCMGGGRPYDGAVRAYRFTPGKN